MSTQKTPKQSQLAKSEMPGRDRVITKFTPEQLAELQVAMDEAMYVLGACKPKGEWRKAVLAEMERYRLSYEEGIEWLSDRIGLGGALTLGPAPDFNFWQESLSSEVDFFSHKLKCYIVTTRGAFLRAVFPDPSKSHQQQMNLSAAFAPALPQEGSTMSTATFTTTDGHQMDALTVSALIGASLPTAADCREAVGILKMALNHGVTHAALWELSTTAVWGGGLPAARNMLDLILAREPGVFATGSNYQRIASAANNASQWSEEITWEDDERPTSASPTPAPTTPVRAASQWSEEITWEDDERPTSTATAANPETAFEKALAQMTMF
jgi:hypothetical protein